LTESNIRETSAPSCAADGSCCGPWSSCCDEYDPNYQLVVTYENATRADIEPVHKLLTANDLPLDGAADFIEHFIVAKAAGRIVGSIGLERYGKNALLRSAAVRKDLQGRGIGRALVHALLDRAERDGVEAVYLLTTTADDYFTEFGFETVERNALPAELSASRELQGACPASATAMLKALRHRDGRTS
jgi:amino-acid N-acetyltransferase